MLDSALFDKTAASGREWAGRAAWPHCGAGLAPTGSDRCQSSGARQSNRGSCKSSSRRVDRRHRSVRTLPRAIVNIVLRGAQQNNHVVGHDAVGSVGNSFRALSL